MTGESDPVTEKDCRWGVTIPGSSFPQHSTCCRWVSHVMRCLCHGICHRLLHGQRVSDRTTKVESGDIKPHRLLLLLLWQVPVAVFSLPAPPTHLAEQSNGFQCGTHAGKARPVYIAPMMYIFTRSELQSRGHHK